MQITLVNGLPDAQPGQVGTLSFQLSSSRPQEVQEGLDLPPGWTALLPLRQDLQLRPDQPTTRLIALSIPRRTPAGTYRIRYEAGRPDAAPPAEALAVVEVRPEPALDLELISSPEWVSSSQGGEALVRLSNQGNTVLSIRVDADRSGAALRTSPAELELQPGEQHGVRVQVQPDATIQAARTESIRVQARATSPGARAIHERSYFAVEVLPTAHRGAPRVRAIPSTATAIGVMDEQGPLAQLELAGRGATGERTELEYVLRGPDISRAGLFADRDELALALRNPDYELLLGDHSYRLSELTSPFRYGRGLGVTVRPGPVEAGGHAMLSRWDEPASRQAGAFLAATPTPDSRLGIQAMHRELGVSANEALALEPVGDSFDALTLAGATPLGRSLSVRGELGGGSSPEGVDFAGFGAARASLGSHTQLAVERRVAGPDFAGAWQDLERTDVWVDSSLPLDEDGSALRLRAEGWRSTSNLARDPTEGPARRTTRLSTSIGGRSQSSWFAESSLAWARARDLLALRDEDGERELEPWTEAAVGLRGGRYGAPLWGSVEATLGQHADPERHERSFVANTGARAGLQGELGSLGASLMWSTPFEGGGLLFSTGGSASLTGTWSPGPQVQASAGYLVQWLAGLTHQVDSEARLALDRRSTVFARGRLRRGVGQEDQLTGLLGYELGFGLPIAPSREVGTLSGRVVDATRTGRPGIRGAMLEVAGRRVVTDDEGRFLLSGLPHGVHLLRLDPTSVGTDWVPARPDQTRVEIERGDLTRTEISLVQAGAVSGQLSLQTESGAQPQPGIALTLSGPGRTQLRMSDEEGRFAFHGLVPGAWTLHLEPGQLPPTEEEPALRQVLHVEPAATSQVDLSLRPRSLDVRWEDSQATVLRIASPHSGGEFGEVVVRACIDRMLDHRCDPEDPPVKRGVARVQTPAGEDVAVVPLEEGIARVPYLRPGPHHVWLEQLPEGLRPPSGAHLVDVPEGDEVRAELPAVAARSIQGRVWAGPPWVPLAGVEVWLSDGRRTHSDDRGYYGFYGLAPGHYTVRSALPEAFTPVHLPDAPRSIEDADLALPRDAIPRLVELRERRQRREQLHQPVPTIDIGPPQLSVGELRPVQAAAGHPPVELEGGLSWHSDAPLVARVVGDRLVALSGGRAHIWASLEGRKSAPTEIRVEGPAIVGLELRAGPIQPDGSVRLRVVALREDGSELPATTMAELSTASEETRLEGSLLWLPPDGEVQVEARIPGLPVASWHGP